ncbi:MAG: DUF167 domain-containing protein [Thermaerobacterales bacterium]
MAAGADLSQLALTDGDGGCVLDVYARPRAGRVGLAGIYGSALRVRVQAPAADGRANRALCEFLAGVFDVPPRAVYLRSGGKSPHKRVFIDGLTAGRARRMLSALL